MAGRMLPLQRKHVAVRGPGFGFQLLGGNLGENKAGLCLSHNEGASRTVDHLTFSSSLPARFARSPCLFPPAHAKRAMSDHNEARLCAALERHYKVYTSIVLSLSSLALLLSFHLLFPLSLPLPLPLPLLFDAASVAAFFSFSFGFTLCHSLGGSRLATFSLSACAFVQQLHGTVY